MPTRKYDLAQLLCELKKKSPIKRRDIKYLLGLSEPADIKQLFEAAREMRRVQFGNTIFLYGFLYFSTHCRNNCRFCQFRHANQRLSRYRKSEKEILATSVELAETGVHLIDLTMGEDPKFYANDGSGFSLLTPMVKKIQEKTGLPLMISPGALPDETLEQLADRGVSWFACYQETHNPTLYRTLRPGQSFKERIRKKRLAKKHGMLIEEGIITGVGESLDDLTDSIVWMKENDVDQARVMTFVPQAGTPMAGTETPGDLQELITIAVMRLALPDRLIPASLDVNGLDGLKARLTAGANVVTSIVPPEKGLAGVAHLSLDIEDSRRTLDHILPVLEQCGVTAASQEDYQSWLKKRQKNAGAG